jgi:hypothetical protein
MIRKPLLRFLRRRAWASLVWAMIPLTFWSGKPTFGCICSDGHFEINCKAIVHQGADGKQVPCGCSCCIRSGKRCCSGARKACCRHSTDTKSGSASITGTACHCQPAVLMATAPTLVKTLRTTDEHQIPAAHVASLENAPLFALAPRNVSFRLDTGPPPDDWVVALHRLLV